MKLIRQTNDTEYEFTQVGHVVFVAGSFLLGLLIICATIIIVTN